MKSLWDRPYVDKTRVGIFGTSYGGYASAHVPAAPSRRLPGGVRLVAGDGLPHTTTRSTPSATCGLPQENKAGYDAGSAMTYAAKISRAG